MKENQPRSRALLVMMAQCIMLLVFAVSAAVCVRILTAAYTDSVRDAARDAALLRAESVAEDCKIHHPTADAVTYYDENWRETDQKSAVYSLFLKKTDAGDPLLGSAEISVQMADDTLLSLPVLWQEVTPHA